MSEAADPDGSIRTELRGNLLFIAIDRPRKLNAFSEKMVLELGAAFARLEAEPEARVAVLHAIGPHFTAGLQLDQLGAWLRDGRHLSPPGVPDPFDLFSPLRTKPVVTAVQGICFTVAIELMLAGDIVVAAADCRFGQIEVRRGIFANHGATLRIVERAGWGNAMRYLLTGDEFDAATAYRLNLVQEIVAPGEQLARATELAETIAAQAPLAVRETLANARKAVFHGWPAAIEEFSGAQQRLLNTDDAAEGLRSFLEKRPGSFAGR